MGKSHLHRTQIHQKFNCIWKKSCRTPEHWQKNSQPSRKARRSLQNEVGWKVKIKEETNNFRVLSAPEGGSLEGRKVSALLETPLRMGSRRASEPERVVQQQVYRGKMDKIHYRYQFWVALPSREVAWMLGLGVHAQVSDSRERTGVGRCEDILRG